MVGYGATGVKRADRSGRPPPPTDTFDRTGPAHFPLSEGPVVFCALEAGMDDGYLPRQSDRPDRLPVANRDSTTASA
jgi:hypothetical protein